MSLVDQIRYRISVDTSQFGAGIREMRGQISGLSETLGGLRGMVAAVGLGALGKEAVGVMSSFEQLEIRLIGVMGGADGAQRAMAWIKDFSTETPFQIDQVTDVFTRLKNFGFDPMDGTLKAITDTAAKFGGGQEMLGRVSLALGQAWTKQRLQGDELLQLTEAGIPVWDMLSTVTGKSALELQKLSERGALGRPVIKALIEEMGRLSDGAAIAQMASLSGQWSIFTTGIKNALDTLRINGGLAPITQLFEDLNAALKRLTDDGSISLWAATVAFLIEHISGVTRELVTTVASVVVDIAQLWGDMSSSVQSSAENQVSIFDWLGRSLDVLASLFVGLRTGVTVVMEGIRLVVQGTIARTVQAWISLQQGVAVAAEKINMTVRILGISMTQFGRVASAALRGDFAGAVAAWKAGTAQVEGIVQASAARVAAISAKAAADRAAAWDNSGAGQTVDRMIAAARAGAEAHKRIWLGVPAMPKLPAVRAGGGGSGAGAGVSRGDLGLDGADGKAAKGGKGGRAAGAGAVAAAAPKSQMSDWQAELRDRQTAYQEQHNLQQMSLADELAFWEGKKALVRAGTDDLKGIERRQGELRVEQMRKDLQKRQALGQVDIEREQREAESVVALQEEAAKQRQAAGEMSQGELLRLQQVFEQDRYQIAATAIQQRLDLAKSDPAQDPAATARLYADLERLQQDHQIRMLGLQGQASAEAMKPFGEFGDMMGSLWDQGMQALLNGTLTWANATRAIVADTGKFFVQHLVTQPLQAWLAGQIKKLALQSGFAGAEVATEGAKESAKTGLTLSGTLARTAILAGGAIKNILINAWEAMAGAFKAMVGIPVIGPALAVGAGVAAFGTVAALVGRVKSARGGFEIPRGANPLMQLHEEEVVLPRKYKQVLDGLAAGEGPAQRADSGAAPVTNHFHVTAVDAVGVRRLLLDHSSAVHDAIKQSVRDGRK